MENATKALEMAAGVLIALLIIGLLAYAYNNLSDEKKIEQSSESAMQASEFNKSYEAFNKSGLQGSEILSLANKIVDYNKKEADKKGYQEIKLFVTINDSTTRNKQYFTKRTNPYEADEIYNNYESLSLKIKNTGVVTKNGKTIAEWAQQASKSIPTEIYDDVSEYKDLLNDQTGIARKTFKAPTVDYEQNGRIKSMSFVEGK